MVFGTATNSHVSAPSKLPIVTSDSDSPELLHHASPLLNMEGVLSFDDNGPFMVWYLGVRCGELEGQVFRNQEG